jgi:hypothetical protein
MKKLINFIALFITLLSFTSCSEEIKPSEDGKETAIVYAVFNTNDSLHYVKINRALNASGDMSTYASVSDSSYFDQVDATVYEYTNGSLTNTFPLNDTIIQGKEDGVFYNPEQKVYYFKSKNLKNAQNVTYKLEAIINGGEFKVYGETNLAGEGMSITYPTDNVQYKFATANVAQDGYSGTNLSFNTGDAQRIELYLDVTFEEFDNTTLLYTKTLNWKVGEFDQEDIKSNLSKGATGQTFYELIKTSVTEDENITKRVLKSINMRVLAANTDLQKFMLVSQPSSSLAQSKASYSNLFATNEMRVVGIFGSRYNMERFKPKYYNLNGTSYGCIDPNSMKELCEGQITGGLFFCSDNPADFNKSYFCN